jgi:hypothetical protein
MRIWSRAAKAGLAASARRLAAARMRFMSVVSCLN